MIYTNINGIDPLMMLWLVDDDYDHDERENSISATTILKPMRQILLGRKYKELEKKIDVSDLIARRIGQAIHSSIEKSLSINLDKNLKKIGMTKPDITTEHRTTKEIDSFIISGKYDIVANRIVRDVKTTSVWSFIFGSKTKDVIKQLSIYKWLNPTEITADYGFVTYIFTDWSPIKAKQDTSYPKRIERQKVNLWSIIETENYIKDKLNSIQIHESVGDIPLCSDEDLWREATKYKVYKTKASKRATKVFNDIYSAEKFRDKIGGGSFVKEFKGGVKRCKYCSYTEICTQYEDLLIKGEIND